jgi:hypothetical protein
VSVLLPTALIVAVVVGWRVGANPVLSFWLAYILTRPLGANLGDWLASPRADGGLGLGTAGTSIVFLLAILATVIYLTITQRDVIELDEHQPITKRCDPGRERIMLGYFAVVAVTAMSVLAWAHAQPHVAASSDEGPAAAAGPKLTPAQATTNFPAADITTLRTIAQATLSKVQAGDQAGATTTVKDLETTWDTDQSTLQPRDKTAWTFLDGEIDAVLQAVRSDTPDTTTERAALQALITSLA